MNRIRIAGQAITSTNYTTKRLFNFSPEKVREAAGNFLASGVTEIEIPEGVLDPEGRFRKEGVDQATLEKTLAGLPAGTKVISSYFGNAHGDLAASRRKLDLFMKFFPDFRQTMLHPPGKLDVSDRSAVKAVVDAWVELAHYGAQRRPGFQCCLHNHYDSSCETADQVRIWLDLLGAADEPALRWGIDTGHSHGMGERYLQVLNEYAPLIGNHFHIKARVPAFDKLHSGDAYAPDRDIWGNQAEVGSGLYGGFVNCADPEIQTPFAEVFKIIREKARPAAGVVTGAVEIDNPRQHPRLEVMCSVLYLQTVHGLETGLNLDPAQIAGRVFGTRI